MAEFVEGVAEGRFAPADPSLLAIHEQMARLEPFPGEPEVGFLLPSNRPLSHPGKILDEDYLKPLGISQRRLADALGRSPAFVRALIRGERPIDAELAWLLAKLFKTSVGYWANGQMFWDLWHARKRLRKARKI